MPLVLRVRALRHGVDPSGRPLLITPADDYTYFNDADLGAIIAYVRSLPAVDSDFPSTEVRPLGRTLFATGQLPIQPEANIDHTGTRRVHAVAVLRADDRRRAARAVALFAVGSTEGSGDSLSV